MNPRQMIVSVCDHSGSWSRPYIEKGYFVLRVDPKHSTECDHGGLGYGAIGDQRLVRMDDGGFGLALTAGQLADAIDEQGGYYLDDLYTQAMHGSEREAHVECKGLLLAPPCTDFSVSGARWFKAKDADGRTEQSVAIVRDCLRLVEALAPDFWCLENPRGRIARLVPELGKWLMHFDPADYAAVADFPDREAYTKDTYLYGDFNPNLIKYPMDPVYYYDSKGNRGSWQWKHLGGKSERTKELRSVTPTGFARSFANANG